MNTQTKNQGKHRKLRALCEGAIMVAAAQLLSYLKFYEMPYGGAVTLGMIPLVFYAIRWGAGPGLLASFVYSVLQLLLDGAYAYTWQSMLLDYLLAYTVLGMAGVFRGKRWGVFAGTVLASVLRFVVHTLAGVYVWAEYMPEYFLGLKMGSPWIYSPLYNSIYVALNMILCLAAFGVMYRPLKRYILGEDIHPQAK